MTPWKQLSEPPSRVTVDPCGARSAAYQALLTLERERKRTRQSALVGESLRDLRERNHFTETIIAHLEMEFPRLAQD